MDQFVIPVVLLPAGSHLHRRGVCNADGSALVAMSAAVGYPTYVLTQDGEWVPVNVRGVNSSDRMEIRTARCLAKGAKGV